MALVVTSPPSVEPVDLAEASLFIRYDQSLQNSVITALITAARLDVEAWTNRTMIDTGYDFFINDLFDEIFIPTSTIIAVSAITYQDLEDATQTLSSTLFKVDNKSVSNKVFRDPLETYPEVLVQPLAVKISFTAGFANVAAVPENLKTVIKMRVAELFEHREANTTAARHPNDAMISLMGLSADYRF